MNKVKKIILFLNTINYLKFNQVRFQLFYRIKESFYIVNKNEQYLISLPKFSFTLPQFGKYFYEKKFCFLNLQKDFESKIDWNFSEYGKLWTYNLEYFDYLNQTDVDKSKKIILIKDFYSFSVQNKKILEPYPVSLRVINIIRFLSTSNIKDDEIINCLFQELTFLSKNLEFHILGNHLLENLFALLLGGYFFNNSSWSKLAEKHLKVQLNEQILDDGAHFELSPMYHQIILFRLLELIDWYGKQDRYNAEFLEFCDKKAKSMLGWLKEITFENGDIPLFKDSAKGIAYTSANLFDFGKFLNLDIPVRSMFDSGYRAFKNNTFEIKMNFAQVGASYQPGHAHADALSFILYAYDKPLLVEQGTSTYQIGARRNLERSTEAHNTVVIDNSNQSEVWGGFRVGKRAKSFIVEESINQFTGYHDGYKKRGTIHKRTFELFDDLVSITDTLTNDKSGIAYFHIAPDILVNQKDNNTFVVGDNYIISFQNADNISLENYLYAESFNVYLESKRLKVSFTSTLNTSINF